MTEKYSIWGESCRDFVQEIDCDPKQLRQRIASWSVWYFGLERSPDYYETIHTCRLATGESKTWRVYGGFEPLVEEQKQEGSGT